MSESKHPKRGVAGKIQRANSTAPEDAPVDLIQRVALTAHQEDADPAEVWEQQAWPNRTLAEYSRGDGR